MDEFATRFEPGNQAHTPKGKILRGRYLRAMRYFSFLTLHVFLWDITLRRIGLRGLPQRTADRRYSRWARRFRELATNLGGVWIKVGQFLSSRVDVLPASVTMELAALQDEVAPEPLTAVREVVEAEFGMPLEACFRAFDSQPLASASLGQVHRAMLEDGSRVVVKVQRKNIDDLIATDLAALAVVIAWLKRYRPIARRADLDALLDEFSRTLWEEVDYLAEAENARRFAEIFAEDPEVRMPRVYAERTTRRVLTLEDVYFIKITDYPAIEAAGVSLSEVARRLFRTYLQQIFEVGFFHADPHPGNLFVEPLEEGWRLVFVDFGMAGQLSPQNKQGLRDLAIAVATQDLDRLMRSYQTLGVLLPGADIGRIREAERAVFDRFWGMSMRELTSVDFREMHDFALEFRDLIYELPFQVPSNLIFLGRCVAILSGMCTGLDPDFNLFQELLPFAQSMLGEGEESVVAGILTWLEEQARRLIALPGRVDAILSRLERGELALITEPSAAYARRLDAITSAGNRLSAAVIFAALLMAGVLLYLHGETALAAGAAGLGFLLLLLMFRL